MCRRERAVLAANMETALNAVWDAQPGPADRIAVVGAGVVGCLVAWLCGRIPGTQVTLCDIDPVAREQSPRRSASASPRPTERPRDCDLVVHASGTPQGLSAAIALAGNEATDTRTELVRSRGGAGFTRRAVFTAAA